MTPDQLLTFSVLSQTLNISHTAKQLHLSQPAVSGQLRLLQDWFGEPLYHRQGHGVMLTSAGQELANYAQQMHSTYSQAQRLRQGYQHETQGTLHLGSTTTPASYLLPQLVAQFRQQHRKVKLAWSAGNTQEILNKLNDFDLAFIEGETPHALSHNTACHAWYQDEIMAITPSSHRFVQKDYLSLAELSQEPLIMREQGSGVRRLIERAFQEQQLAPEISLELAGIEGIKQAVRAGLGIGFVSALSMRTQDPSLQAIRITRQGLHRDLTILMPNSHHPSRVTQAFLDHCLKKPND